MVLILTLTLTLTYLSERLVPNSIIVMHDEAKISLPSTCVRKSLVPRGRKYQIKMDKSTPGFTLFL